MNHLKALEPAFIAGQREKLIAARIRLANGVQRKDAEDRLVAGADSDQANETEDLAQDLTMTENNDALSATLTEQLALIDRALAKIDEGTYGFSDQSGEPIALARLQAYPEAILTLDEAQAALRRAGLRATS